MICLYFDFEILVIRCKCVINLFECLFHIFVTDKYKTKRFMNLKSTFLAVVSTLLITSCGTSSVDSKKCVSYTIEVPSSQVIDTYVYTFNYSDSKLVGFKYATTYMAGDVDSTLYQVQYNNNLVESTNEHIFRWNSPEVVTSNSVFEYDSEGRMKSEVQKLKVDGNVSQTQNISYVWSNNDLKVDMFVDVDTEDSVYLIRTYHFNSFGQIVYTLVDLQNNTGIQQYYDDKNSPFKNIIFPLRIAYYRHPPFDKINNINGINVWNVQHNYTYDDDDFPTSLDIINEDGTINSTHTWTYD